MASDDEVNVEDVMRIMISTDNHLGYAEKDPVRGEDSFNAFEEMLEIAVEEDVDFILLGGDLFHDAVPSQNSLHRCMKLLRRYTFGDKPIEVEFLSDQTMNFHNAVNDCVNYEDPNLNISIPVFSIHGNHDDPSGFSCLSSLDLLSTTGLVNYFGRWTDLSKIEINPILLRKGQTQLALYGLSHIHDARLVRLFHGANATINRPSDENEWFHLFVLHQNRYDRGPKNFVPEEILPSFLDLIIWGHEHDCRLEPEHNVKKDFFVSQPGSSVPTSLAEGEAKKKHVGILSIYKRSFKMKAIPLQSVRPFIFESVNMNKLTEELLLDEGDVSNKVKNFAEQRLGEMIERAKDMLTGHPRQPTLPLLRLRIEFSEEEQMFNAIRLGQTFNEKVANPADIVTFKKIIKRVKGEGNEKCDKEAMKKAFEEMDIDVGTRVEDLVDRYFEEVKDTKALRLVTSKVFSEMCYRLVERRDVNAAESIINYYKENAVAHLMEKLPTEENIREELSNFRDKVQLDDILKMLDNRGSKPYVPATTSKAGAKSSKSNLDKDFLFSDDFDNTTSVTATGAKGRGRGRGGRGSRGGGARGKTTMKPLNITVGSNDSFVSTTETNTIGRGRSARGTRASAARDNDIMAPLNVKRTRSSERQQSLVDALKSVKTRKQVVVIDDSDDE